MRIRGAGLLFTIVLVAACSSEESLNPQPLPPQEETGRSPGPPAGASGDSSNLGTCNGTCCSKPAEGSACDTTNDTTCTWAVTCPTGLVLPYELTCTNGAWQLTNGCPAEGQTDSRGCPARQPENGTPCSLSSSSGSGQCGYVLECTGYRKSALANCFNNGTGGGFTWQTTPLGTCD